MKNNAGRVHILFIATLAIMLLLVACGREKAVEYEMYKEALPTRIMSSTLDTTSGAAHPNADFYYDDKLVGGIRFHLFESDGVRFYFEDDFDTFLDDFYHQTGSIYYGDENYLCESNMILKTAFEVIFYSPECISYQHNYYMVDSSLVCEIWFDTSEFSNIEISDIIQNLNELYI